MSDANLLNPPDIDWSYDGQTFCFGRCDLDVETMFQNIHERWAVNRIETLRGGVSPAAYETVVSRIADQIATNRFAFGGPLSWQFLFSPQGMTEYLALLAKKAKRTAGAPLMPVTVATLDAYRRADEQGWERLWKTVARRDFPNQVPPEEEGEEQKSTSEPGETSTPFTTESRSPLPVGPGV